MGDTRWTWAVRLKPHLRVITPWRSFPLLKSISRGGEWASLGRNRLVTREVRELRYRLNRMRRREAKGER